MLFRSLTKEGYEFWKDYVNAHGGMKVAGKTYKVESRGTDRLPLFQVEAKSRGRERSTPIGIACFDVSPAQRMRNANTATEYRDIPRGFGRGSRQRPEWRERRNAGDAAKRRAATDHDGISRPVESLRDFPCAEKSWWHSAAGPG